MKTFTIHRVGDVVAYPLSKASCEVHGVAVGAWFTCYSGSVPSLSWRLWL